MSRHRLLHAGLLGLALVFAVPAAADGFYTSLDVVDVSFENVGQGAVVTVVVTNPSAEMAAGLVGVVGTTTDGTRIRGTRPLWVPPGEERSVTVHLAAPIATVSRSWVMRLSGPSRPDPELPAPDRGTRQRGAFKLPR